MKTTNKCFIENNMPVIKIETYKIFTDFQIFMNRDLCGDFCKMF